MVAAVIVPKITANPKRRVGGNADNPKIPNPTHKEERSGEHWSHNLGPSPGRTLQGTQAIITKVPDPHYRMNH